MGRTFPVSKLSWAQLSKFAQSVAVGQSASAAYAAVRPGIAKSTADSNGAALMHHPRTQKLVATMRQALVEKSTAEFILNRDEVLRVHTLAALTPVGEVDERHFLAQEVVYKYATDEDGLPIQGDDGKPMVTEKKVKMVSKSDSLKEISKLQGFYVPEKLEIRDTTKRDDALQRLADDPLFAELMAQQAPIVARSIEARVIEERGMSAEEREEAAKLDDDVTSLY